MKVVHIITGLGTGGAETVLYKLLSRIVNDPFVSEVVSLTDIGPMGQKILALGVPVRSLGMRRGIPNPIKVLKLANWLRKSGVDVVQTWMYHADLIGGLAAKMAGGIPVNWGIHHCNLEPQYNKRSTIITAKVCAHLSNWVPEKIVCCSDAAQHVHGVFGYTLNKMIVIPNGIDLSVFKPNSTARELIHNELKVDEGTPLIGMVARFDSQKDHRNFVDAARRLHAEYPYANFLLCGSGINWNNRSLVSRIDDAGLRSRFHLLGVRQDIEVVTASLDIATSSSFGESFSLALGEAMACGVPCVTTNVAAPVDLLGGCGWVVPIHDSLALFNAWKEILVMPDDEKKVRLDAARERISRHFSLDAMSERYRRLFVESQRES